MNVFTNNADFYPTPDEVINTMMMGENFIGIICKNVHCVLFLII